MEEDWDLQAVIRGFNCSEASTAVTDDSNSSFDTFIVKQEDILLNFNDLLETKAVLDELEQLYQPFYPVDNAFSPLQAISNTPASASSPPIKLQPQDLQKWQLFSASSLVASTSTNHPNHGSQQQQTKRRSYYRCSSCKGCSARKKVERCRSDPRMFIITYLSEHNHSLPTRRNSLAGSTRHKFTTSPNNKLPNLSSTTAIINPNSPSTSATLSSVASLEESKVRTRGTEDDEEQVGNVLQNDDTIVFGNDDSFLCWGLEDFEGLNNSISAAFGHGSTGQFDESFSRPWSVDEQGL
ncbi:WRKY domain [Dillenia turbinata]|uniref:WRKY domain n=1 Tax=Dillenia turbinata TaxID=194707 RepID=A0AAN8WA01_9MAGN